VIAAWVLVGAGVTTIAAGNVTDKRTFSPAGGADFLVNQVFS
jgi:hypothetical protein